MAQDMGSETVKEAVGVFLDTDSLCKAIEELRDAGFARSELGVLAREPILKERLGSLFTRVDDPEGDPNTPPVDWIRHESMGDAVHGLVGGVAFAGAATAAGTAIATVGLFGGAILTAGVAAAAVGSLGAVLAAIIAKSDAEYLQEQIDRGHLLLFVRVRDAARERRASEILAKHALFEPKVHSVETAKSPAG
ncbi:MAG: hypothetical protein R3322_22810 [Kiloniellales bacterium]|nr:hypothetical protein [Kiloniellales bacterium]